MVRDTDEPMDLRQYLMVLRRRAVTVLLVAAVCVAGALAFAASRVPMYTSTATVLVRMPNFVPGEPQGGLLIMGDQEALASSPEVAQRAAEAEPEAVAGASVSAAARASTNVLVFTAKSHTAAYAQKAAQASAEAYLAVRRAAVLNDLDAATTPVDQRLASARQQLAALQPVLAAAKSDSERAAAQGRLQSLLSQVADLEERRDTFARPQDLRSGDLIGAATPATASSLAPVSRLVPLAALVGLALGAGAAFLRDRSDPVVRDAAGVSRATGLPVVAVLAAPGRKDEGWSGRSVEALSPLRSRLLALGEREGVRSILVTGAEGSGHERVALQLADSLAAAGRTATLVTVVTRAAEQPAHRPAVGGGLPPAANQDLEPVSLAGWSGFVEANGIASLIADVRSGELLVAEAPGVLVSGDAVVVACKVDAVVLVAEQGRSRVEQERQAAALLDEVGARVVGVVLLRRRRLRLRRARQETRAVPDLVPAPVAGVVPMTARAVPGLRRPAR